MTVNFNNCRLLRTWVRCVLVCLSGCGGQAMAQAAAPAAATAPAMAASQQVPAPVAVDDPDSELSLVALLRRQAVAYENGEGVERDPLLAAKLYCKAARLGDPESQYSLGWMYTNARGVPRDDLISAFFFNAAAEQGMDAAKRMLKAVGGATPEVPECMRDAPAPVAVAQTTRRPLKPPVDYRAIAPPHIFDLVTRLAPVYKVEPQLVFAIIHAESNFDSLALSGKNARGLMQLIPDTAERFNVRNSYDPAQNIRGGMSYLRWLLAYFEGDVALVAAAYNAGEGKVERYRGIPPYLETRAYVLKVLKAVGMGLHPFDPAVTKPSASLPLFRLVKRVR